MKQHAKTKNNLPNLIDTYREEGKTDQEIYHQLRETSEEKWRIYTTIASRVRKEDLSKNITVWNSILVAILIFIAVSKLALSFILLKEDNSPLLLLMTLPLFTSILPLYFAIQIYQYKGYAYRVLILFTVIGLLNTISAINLDSMAAIIDFFITASISLVIIIIADHMGKTLFPQLRVFFIKPRDGEYKHLLKNY